MKSYAIKRKVEIKMIKIAFPNTSKIKNFIKLKGEVTMQL